MKIPLNETAEGKPEHTSFNLACPKNQDDTWTCTCLEADGSDAMPHETASIERTMEDQLRFERAMARICASDLLRQRDKLLAACKALVAGTAPDYSDALSAFSVRQRAINMAHAAIARAEKGAQ